MKFRLKTIYERLPEEIIKRHFCIVPVYCRDIDHWVWLEWVWRRKYVQDQGMGADRIHVSFSYNEPDTFDRHKKGVVKW